MKNANTILVIVLAAFLFNSCKKDKPKPPALTTAEITEISYTTATSGGNLTEDGGAPVLSMGVCWNTSPQPTVDNTKTVESAKSGAFISKIDQLSQNTTYYVRAFATNSSGTGYGNQVSFMTSKVAVPALTTASVLSITENSAVSGGNITSDNGGSITASGVCWATTINPTTSNNKTSEGTGVRSFSSSITGLSGGTIYYVRAYAVNTTGTAYGNEISFTTSPAKAPVLTTASVSSLSTTSVFTGGTVTSNGGAAVISHGVCWGTTQNPTIANNKTNDGSDSGAFTSNITGLTPNTTYYIRAYATNNVGTSYGNELVVLTYALLDVDGNGYHSVTLGTQTWMKENLKTTKYVNGDLIGTTTPVTLNIISESTPKYQWAYEGNESQVSSYGRNYTWYAATDSRRVCPTGWHVPTDNDWTLLETYLTTNGYGYEGSGNDIGKALASSSGWTENSVPGTIGNNQASNNSSGFTGIPTGYRYYEGSSAFAGMMTYWWSATEKDSQNAYYRNMSYLGSTFSLASWEKKNGYAIRCLKD